MDTEPLVAALPDGGGVALSDEAVRILRRYLPEIADESPEIRAFLDIINRRADRAERLSR